MDIADRPVRVALLGYGTVGSALHRLLVEHRAHVREATGHELDVAIALVRDSSRARAQVDDVVPQLTESLDDVLAARPDVVCEAMGGIEPARSHVLTLLDHGIAVVTANKQLIARHGTELFARAHEAGVQLRFEASVCGALPIIRMLRESLTATRIDRLVGILNGTTNFILSAMTATGASYDDALADAQRLGFAEADPTDDVDGIDAAAKLAILGGIAFGTTIDPEAIDTTGMSGVRAHDIRHAQRLGCRIRLLARGERDGQRDDNGGRSIALEVAPMLVSEQHPLARVDGSTNAVLVDGEPFGRLVVQGAGAGGPETASALAGDVVSVVGSEPSFLTRDPHVTAARARSFAETTRRWYVRLEVADEPGVLAAVARALATCGISIEQVVQEHAAEGEATLVLTTHPCAGTQLQEALAQMPGNDRSVLPILDDAHTQEA